MGELAALVLSAVEEWRKTGKLPNGEYWQPGQAKHEKEQGASQA